MGQTSAKKKALTEQAKNENEKEKFFCIGGILD
jgi:hypothetical protein